MVEKALRKSTAVHKSARKAELMLGRGGGRIAPRDPDQVIGKLKFVSSNGRTCLTCHRGSVPGRGMAAEMGLRSRLRGRAGLLHGTSAKAIDQESRRRQAWWEQRWPRNHGERRASDHASDAHHGDVGPDDVMDHWSTCHVCPARPPGRAREMLESYVQRLFELKRSPPVLPRRRAFAYSRPRGGGLIVEN